MKLGVFQTCASHFRLLCRKFLVGNSGHCIDTYDITCTVHTELSQSALSIISHIKVNGASQYKIYHTKFIWVLLLFIALALYTVQTHVICTDKLRGFIIDHQSFSE